LRKRERYQMRDEATVDSCSRGLKAGRSPRLPPGAIPLSSSQVLADFRRVFRVADQAGSTDRVGELTGREVGAGPPSSTTRSIPQLPRRERSSSAEINSSRVMVVIVCVLTGGFEPCRPGA
jgi:hypothetical protein